MDKNTKNIVIYIPLDEDELKEIESKKDKEYEKWLLDWDNNSMGAIMLH